jgi:hypothetical protein
MVTKSSELRTYYQRNWGEDYLPTKLSSQSIVKHVAEHAIPFLGFFYKPACTAISLGQSFVNAAVFLTCLLEGEEGCRPQRTPFNAWCCFKNFAEFVGTIASLRIGLAVHTVTNLGENLYASREFKTAPLSQTFDKMSSVVSNALYLLTLVSFSTPVSYGVIGASLVFQAAWSLNKARAKFTSLMEPPKILDNEEFQSRTLQDNKNGDIKKKLSIAAHLAMAGIYLREVMKVHQAAYPLWTKAS